MSDSNEGKEVIKQIHVKQKSDFRESVKNSTPVLVLKGIWMFAEGTAQLGLGLFAVYQAKYGSFPMWGKYGLTIAGVLILVPAALLLAKFFRGAAKA